MCGRVAYYYSFGNKVRRRHETGDSRVHTQGKILIISLMQATGFAAPKRGFGMDSISIRKQ